MLPDPKLIFATVTGSAPALRPTLSVDHLPNFLNRSVRLGNTPHEIRFVFFIPLTGTCATQKGPWGMEQGATFVKAQKPVRDPSSQ